MEFIKMDVADGVAVMTLDREPLNVLNIAMMREMNAALDELKGQDLKVFVFKAAGKAFSAGVDVGEHLGDQVEEMIEVFHGIFRRLDKLGLVTVASVQGAALGGGCEVAAFCDIVIASEKAKFAQPEIMVGVFPPIAALVFPRHIGYKKAMELILTGATIGAAEAKELGLVNQVVAPEELEEATNKMVAKLSGLSGAILKVTKKAVLKGLDKSERDEALGKIEKIYLKECMTMHDAEEGLKAFLEKRKPEWSNT